MRMTTDNIDTVLQNLNMPGVNSWHIETGPDATNDAAVWVWIILQNEGVERATRDRLRSQVREAVREAANTTPPWVYVRFRTVAEEETA